MADYIYLLETRLTRDQQAALTSVRNIARDHELTVFLVGGAIRDLISGAPVRDLDVAVQGNALKLKKELEKVGGEFSAENIALQQLHFRFSGGVRIEIGSTLTTAYPKPGKVTVKPTTILDDLRRRDFTANAMALSLNEGSYGLLMDPLNGVADIENRELRLVSNYGFIEDPVRLIRAARLMARLGWRLDEKTQARYETAKEENYIAAMQPGDRAYELEELFHEEDPLRVMQRLEDEGWLKQLAPAMSVSKANVAELGRLKDTQSQLYEQGVLADAAAANFPLLTAKLSAKDVQALKENFPRKGFVREIDSLESKAKEFANQLAGKQAALPSQAFRLITGSVPVVVLWTAFSSKNASVQGKYKSFYSEWPQNRQRLPYLLMQEMRITPELPGYEDLLQKLFFALMDGQLETPEAMRAFLEPYSPPAPPPPVSVRRPRAAKAAKKETRSAKARKKVQEAAPDTAEAAASEPVSVAVADEAPVSTARADGNAPSATPKSPSATQAKGDSVKGKVASAKDSTAAGSRVKAKTIPLKGANAGQKAKAPTSRKTTPAKKASRKPAARSGSAGKATAKSNAKVAKAARSSQRGRQTGSKQRPAALRGAARPARPSKKAVAALSRKSGAKTVAAAARGRTSKRPPAKRSRR